MTGYPPLSICLVPPMRWWQRFRKRLRVHRKTRVSAGRHLRVVATALLTGDTSGYQFVPTLPRVEGSSEVDLGSSNSGSRYFDHDDPAVRRVIGFDDVTGGDDVA